MSDLASDANARMVEDIIAIVAAAAAEHLTEESEAAFVYEILRESDRAENVE